MAGRRCCPICEARFFRFRKTYDWSSDRGTCPSCGSVQRHRHLWLFLERHTNLLSGANLRVLHFAAEPGIRARLRRQPALDYLTADLDPQRADVAADLVDLPFADASFDVILCVHVLEHVLDDATAFRELRRVLRPGGWAILQVPIQGETTVEDPTAVTPEERTRKFGRPDHVRMYGRDFIERVRQGGFDVDVTVFRDELTDHERHLYGLNYDLPFAVDFNEIREPWEIYRAVRPA